MAETDSLDARIKRAIDPLGYPVQNGIYQDTNEIYFTFTYSTRGTLYADNEPNAEIADVMLELFAPHNVNITRLIRQTKAAIHGAGFTWAGKTDLTDKERRHIVFEFQDAEGVDL